ncbi:hypothetical protein [Natronorubrum sp. FCH18a]|uniref:hypothetical protein n=1 Tax=Natronorubrum sp. FCH18a TaxID=3447018 RepID=UPI003F51791B
MFGYEDYLLYLQFNVDSDYDPTENDVYLLDGEVVTSEGYVRLFDPDGRLTFELSNKQITDGGPYRVVSRTPIEIVDEFELTLELSR